MNTNSKDEKEEKPEEEKKPLALKELEPEIFAPRVVTPKNYVAGKGGGCVGSVSNGVFGNYTF